MDRRELEQKLIRELKRIGDENRRKELAKLPCKELKEMEDAESEVTELQKQVLESIKPGSMQNLFNHPLFQQALDKFVTYTLKNNKECKIEVGIGKNSDLSVRLKYGSEDSVEFRDKEERFGKFDVFGITVFESHSHPEHKVPIFSYEDLECHLGAIHKMNCLIAPTGVSVITPDRKIITLYWLPNRGADNKTIKKLYKRLEECYAGKGITAQWSERIDSNTIVRDTISELHDFGGMARLLFFRYSNGKYIPIEDSMRFLEQSLDYMKEINLQKK